MKIVIAFEGLAGSGKSTTMKTIKERLGSRCHIVEEFPEEFLDGYMSIQSKERPQFSFSNEFKTPLTQTFMMVANAAYKMESIKNSILQYDVCIYDRYIESFLAYQAVAMKDDCSNYAIQSFKDSIRLMFPEVDAIFYFFTSEENTRQRLENRGLSLDKSFYDYLSYVGKYMEENLSKQPNVIMIDTGNQPDVVAGFILEKIEELRRNEYRSYRKSQKLCPR